MRDEPLTIRSAPDPIVESMKRRGIPLTLQNWLDLAFPEGAPNPIPGELLQCIPIKELTATDSEMAVALGFAWPGLTTE